MYFNLYFPWEQLRTDPLTTLPYSVSSMPIYYIVLSSWKSRFVNRAPFWRRYISIFYPSNVHPLTSTHSPTLWTHFTFFWYHLKLGSAHSFVICPRLLHIHLISSATLHQQGICHLKKKIRKSIYKYIFKYYSAVE